SPAPSALGGSSESSREARSTRRTREGNPSRSKRVRPLEAAPRPICACILAAGSITSEVSMRSRSRVAASVLLSLPLAVQQPPPAGPGAVLRLLATTPAAVSTAPVSTTVSVLFDRPVALNTIDAASFRVFGRYSGAARGSFGFADGGRRVTFTPAQP